MVIIIISAKWLFFNSIIFFTFVSYYFIVCERVLSDMMTYIHCSRLIDKGKVIAAKSKLAWSTQPESCNKILSHKREQI